MVRPGAKGDPGAGGGGRVGVGEGRCRGETPGDGLRADGGRWFEGEGAVIGGEWGLVGRR